MIRQARISDAEEVCDLLIRSIRELCTKDHNEDEEKLALWLANKTVENCRNWISEQTGRFWVTVEGPRIAGVASAGEDGYLRLLYVNPDRVHAGIGSALLATVEEWAKQSEMQEIYLDSTATALGFYTRYGYLARGSGYVSKGMIVYPLYKRIALA